MPSSAFVHFSTPRKTDLGTMSISIDASFTTVDIPYLCLDDSKVLTRFFHPSRTYIGRFRKDPSHLDYSPDDNNLVYTLNHHHLRLQLQTMMIYFTLNHWAVGAGSPNTSSCT